MADELEQIFRLTVEAPDADLAAVVRGEWEPWDSLAHASLVFTTEQELGVELTPEDIEGIDSYAALREAVSRARRPQ